MAEATTENSAPLAASLPAESESTVNEAQAPTTLEVKPTDTSTVTAAAAPDAASTDASTTAPAQASEEILPEAAVEASTETSATEPTEPKVESEQKKAPSEKKDGGDGRTDAGSQTQPGSRRYGRGVRSDLTSLPESSDPDEIRRQVEFYFSDSNLVQDKFLLEQVGGSKNKSVPIKIIHSFKRMRHFQPYSAVVQALKESDVLDVTDEEEIKRKTPLPEIVGTALDRDTIRLFEDKAQPRSIYAKGFGEEGEKTQFEIEEFFAPYGPVNAIRLRRHYPDRNFKGSVFVEFKDADTQQAFLALETKPAFHGKDLLIMSKKEYVEKKAEDVRSGKIKSNRRDEKDWNSRRDDFQRNGYRDSRGRGGRGGGRGRGRGRDTRDRDGRRGRDGRRDRSTSPAKAGQEESATAQKTGENTKAAPEPSETKKRSHEEDGAEDAQREAKKAKAEDVAAES